MFPIPEPLRLEDPPSICGRRHPSTPLTQHSRCTLHIAKRRRGFAVTVLKKRDERCGRDGLQGLRKRLGLAFSFSRLVQAFPFGLSPAGRALADEEL